MPLRTPEASVGVGLATAAISYSIFDMSLPPLVDVRSVESDNRDVQSAERAATWVAAAFVSAVALMTKDATVFVIGGVTIVALAWLYRHADQVSPLTGTALPKITVPGMTSQAEPEPDTTYVDASI